MIEMSAEEQSAKSAANAKSIANAKNAESAKSAKNAEREVAPANAKSAESAKSVASEVTNKITEIVEQVKNETGIFSKIKIAGFLFAVCGLVLFGLALNKGMKYAVEQPYWKVIHTEITKNIGISFAMMFLFFVVSIIYYLQDTSSGIQNLFVLLLFVFLLSFSAISLGIVTR